MFVNAIKDLTKFTSPMQTISRAYGHKEIIPGLSTLFFVNENGVAITCKHVANLIISADPTNQQFNQFKTERDQLAKDGKYQRNIKGLELKYKYQKDTTIQIKNNFVGAVDNLKEITPPHWLKSMASGMACGRLKPSK